MSELDYRHELNSSALLPAVLCVISFLLSPDFFNILPDKAAHLLAAISALASILFPKLLSKRYYVKEQQEKE